MENLTAFENTVQKVLDKFEEENYNFSYDLAEELIVAMLKEENLDDTLECFKNTLKKFLDEIKTEEQEVGDWKWKI